jgi:hypothetical protein
VLSGTQVRAYQLSISTCKGKPVITSQCPPWKSPIYYLLGLVDNMEIHADWISTGAIMPPYLSDLLHKSQKFRYCGEVQNKCLLHPQTTALMYDDGLSGLWSSRLLESVLWSTHLKERQKTAHYHTWPQCWSRHWLWIHSSRKTSEGFGFSISNQEPSRMLYLNIKHC